MNFGLPGFIPSRQHDAIQQHNMKKFIAITVLAVFTAGIANAAPSRFHKRIVASATKGSTLPAVAAGPTSDKSEKCDKCAATEKSAKQAKR